MNRLSRRTFNDFIVGNGNRAAFMAALEVARHPGSRYNPLFLYGGTGTGKSHLLAAIAREITRNDPSLSVHYTSYQTLAAQVEEALDTGSHGQMQKTLSKVDIFLLDDVRNDDTWLTVQQEMIDWIDRFIQEERQIILASDKSPLELDPYEERFLSRIQLGLVVSIERVDREVKKKLIARLMEAEGVDSTDDALDFLAGLPVGDIRELAGIVNRLLVSLSVDKAALTGEWLTATLRHLIKTGEIRKFRIEPAVRSGTEGVRQEWFETTELEEPESSENELLSIEDMDAQLSEEPLGDTDPGVEEEREVLPVQTVSEEDIEESEGFFMEWDREIDRLLDEL